MYKQEEELNLMAAELDDSMEAVETLDREEVEGLENIGVSADEEIPMTDVEAPGEETAEQITPDMEGVWFEGTNEEMGASIQDEAQKRGWTGIVDKDTESEGFWDSVKQAEEYMNELVPDGFWFTTNERGGWGLFALEGGVEEVVAPPIADQRVVEGATEDDETEEKLSEEEEKALEALHNEDDDELEKEDDSVISPASDSPLGYFTIKVTPPEGSPFHAKNLRFLISAPESEIQKAVEQKLSDLTKHYQSLEPDMKVEVEGPSMISDIDVVGDPKSDEPGDLATEITSGDMDFARENPGEAHASYGAETSRGAKESEGGSVGGSGERAIRMRSSIQLKNGQLFWAADDTIPQKPLPSGYRWVKVGDTYVQMKDDEAATMASVIALHNASIASEFRDDLYPIKAEEIKEGDRVYVRPMMRFATVVGIEGGRYLVQANKTSGVFWQAEVELR